MGPSPKLTDGEKQNRKSKKFTKALFPSSPLRQKQIQG
jgi:hypothetical protein